MPTEPFPERPASKRIVIMLILLLSVLSFYVLNIIGIFDEVEEPEGIFVKFILFFKQNTFL